MKNPFSGIRGIIVLRHEPLARHTSFRIGGAAAFLVKVYSLRALSRVLAVIHEKKMKYFIIGAGTNVLISDRPFQGVVLKLYGIFKNMKHNSRMLECGGGVLIDSFVKKASALGYSVDFLAGIPGTIGGGIKGNAGAFGKSFADITDSIRVIEKGGSVRCVLCADIGFGYRTSHIKNGSVIISARLNPPRGERRKIMQAVRRTIAYRRKRQPRGYSVGSFFKNPLPHTAGALIEACGLKGLRVHDAEVSTKHANWIINRGHATAADVKALARMIKKIVREKEGICLEEEVTILN